MTLFPTLLVRMEHISGLDFEYSAFAPKMDLDFHSQSRRTAEPCPENKNNRPSPSVHSIYSILLSYFGTRSPLIKALAGGRAEGGENGEH